MSTETTIGQDEKVMAALAHGSVLLGPLTNGVGGVIAALVIWLIQKEKSAYAAAQALQALVYQAATTLLTLLVWCCWGVLWVAMIVPPIAAHPELYENAVPTSFWVGLGLMAIPLLLWTATILYGLWGAVRCLGGHDFKYAIIGRWLDRRS